MIGCLLTLMASWPRAAPAQQRELQRYGPGSPEGKLLLYYSSSVAFSWLGASSERSSLAGGRPDRGGGTNSARLEAAVEVSYLPPLSRAQRTAGSDKPEATNLAPLFARPRLGARLPGGMMLELSWIPPMRVFDVKANLFAGAVSRPVPLTAAVRVIPRVAVLGGRVEGPITCNRDTAAAGDAALATYYAFVCRGNDSRDFFEPRHLSGELLLARGAPGSPWQPYASLGARMERTRFDVGVILPDGTRDRDEPILEVRTTRAYGTAGVSWLGTGPLRWAAELFYAPGSVLTVRALAGVRLW